MRVLVLSIPLLLAACASSDGDDPADARLKGWPSLAPRPGEVSPLVPRVPLGAFAGCGPDARETAAPVLAPLAALPLPQPVPLPADAAARLQAAEAVIAAVEADAGPARARARAAIAAAGPGAEPTEAEVQRSRFEALFLQLGPAAADIEALMPALESDPALAARAAALAARLEALDTERRRGLD